MTTVKVSCDSCGQSWDITAALTFYEQQAMESCPCPGCGAYTLTCHEPQTQEDVRVRRPGRSRVQTVAVRSRR